MYSKVFTSKMKNDSIKGMSNMLGTPEIRAKKRTIFSEVVCLPSPSLSVHRGAVMGYMLCFNKNELWPY